MITIKDVLNHVLIIQKSRAEKYDAQLMADGYDVKEAYLQYKSAITGLDSVYSYSFTIEDLKPYEKDKYRMAMMTRPDSGPSSINKFLTREQIVDLLSRKRVDVVNKYMEYNPYYRELLGLPPLKKKIVFDDRIKIDIVVYEPDPSKFYYHKTPITGVDISKPVHEWDIHQKSIFRTNILKTIPEATLRRLPYLNHVHKNMNIITLRDAGHLELVWSDIRKSNNNTYNLLPFIFNYRMIHKYYMANHFNKYDTDKTEFWERIQCIILFLMTLIVTMARNEEIRLNSSEIPLDEIYNLYESYGVPKFRFSKRYLNLFASKINSFIYKKATNINLEDLSDVFRDIKIFKYYLVKTLVDDQNIDPTNNYEKYDLKYVKTPLLVDSPFKYMDDPNNIVPFRDVVDNDARWGHSTVLTKSSVTGELISDPKLEYHLKDQPFSWVESKYLGIDSTVDLANVSLKISALYRWMIENKDITMDRKIYFEILDKDVSIYELFIYLQVLIFRKYKRKPSIPDTLQTYFKVFTISENIDTSAIINTINRIAPSVMKKSGRYVTDRMTIAGNKMQYDDLNYVSNEYFSRRGKSYERMKDLLDKYVIHMKSPDHKYDSYYSMGNLTYTDSDDIKFFNEEKQKYELNKYEDKPSHHKSVKGVIVEKLIDFVKGTSDNAEMYNTYSAFEINMDTIMMLMEMRAKTSNYEDYEMMDVLIKALTEGEKVVKHFKKSDGSSYDNLEEYLLSLNPGNNIYYARLQELEENNETRMDAYNNEISEVVILLRDKAILNPDEHTHADTALDYIQRLYADAEVIKYLIELIDFFKSYTQDLIYKGITFVFDSSESYVQSLEHLMILIEKFDWDIGTAALTHHDDPNERLEILNDKLEFIENVITGERLMIYNKTLNKYIELTSDGLQLT